MTYSESGGARILLCLGLLVFAGSFCSCTELSRLKPLGKLTEKSALSQGRVEGSGLGNGRLLIGPNSVHDGERKRPRVDADYQADMAWAEARQAREQSEGLSMLKQDNLAVEQLLRLEPKVVCTGDSMKLQVHDSASKPGSLLYVDRGSQYSPLPLSKLPPSCGYTVTSTRREFVLVAPYDGCFVSLQEDNYVLPLRWHGLPVRMSCPLIRPSSPNPPMVTCHCEGMVVRTEWMISVDKIKVNLNGNWEPLMNASSKCGFSVVEHPEGVVISLHYAPCLEEKDGMYILELTGDGETKISCPVLFETQTKPTGKDPEKQPEIPGKGVHHPIPPRTPCPPSVVPKVPGIPQNPEVPYQKPTWPKENGQPPFPFHPQSPYFFYSYPGSKPLPTAQPPTSPDGQQMKQTLPPFTPPQDPRPPSVVPEVPSIPQNPEVPYQKPTWPKETGQPPFPFHPQSPYFLYPFADTKPLPTAQPPTSPDGQQMKQTLPPFIPPQDPRPPSAVPEVPGIPHNPEVPYQKPTWPKETGQPPFPFHPQSPYFLYPYADTKPLPTAQPPTPPDGQQMKQTLPPFIPPQDPRPQSVVPEVPGIPQNPEVPYQKPTWPKETGQPPFPFHPQSPYFFYSYPGTKPLPTAQPPTSPDGQQMKQTLPPFIPPHDPRPQSVVPEVPSIPASQPPNGKVVNPYLYYFMPPNQYPAQKPELNPVSPGQRPPKHETPPPQGKYVPNPFNPPPEGPPSTPVLQKPPVSQEPKGQVYQPFSQFPLWPHIWPQSPFQTPMPPKPETPTLPPKGQEQYLIPLKRGTSEPSQSPSKPTSESKKPLQPEAPNGWLYQYPYQYLPENATPKPTAAPQPQQPEAPLGQQLYYQLPLYPSPEPENGPAQKPVDKPSYPQSSETPTEKPAPSEQPHVKPPNGRFYPPHIYYPLLPQLPQPVTLPPASFTQPPKQITTAQPKNYDIVSQSPQSGYPYMPPMLCPQVCPSEFSNCCPQIAFHQHLHHYVPSGFSNYLTALPPQEPSEAATSTQPPTSPQSLIKNEKNPYLLPLDGTHAAPRDVPREPSNTKPIYPYFIPKKHYSYEPQTANQHNIPQPSSDGPGNPVMQYEPYYIQRTGQQMSQPLPVDLKPPSWHDFMSVAQYQQQPLANDQSEPSAKKPQRSNERSIEQTGTVHSLVDRPLVPYSMLQDDQALTNSSQSSESGSKKPSHERTIQTRPESRGYVLLQRGPPGRESDLLDSDFHHHNLNPPQEKLQRPGWLEKMSNPLPVEYMPRPVDESAIDLSSERPLSAAHFKPEFIKSLKDMWKPITQGANQKNQAYGQERPFIDRALQD